MCLRDVYKLLCLLGKIYLLHTDHGTKLCETDNCNCDVQCWYKDGLLCSAS